MDLAEQLKQVEADLQEVSSRLEKAEKEKAELLSRQEQLRLQLRLQARRDADPATYAVKITNYAWDQSDKYVKVYLTLKGVHEIPSENVEVSFTERSFSVLVKGLEGKNHQMTMTNLLGPIDPKDSFKKIKSDMAMIMCKKKKEAEKWDYLTQVEKQSKEKKDDVIKPAVDENDADPGSALMEMMRKMYSEGDDEMKRTINKAWTESQEKKLRGENLMDF